jgi:ethanolamine utilization protein EutN
MILGRIVGDIWSTKKNDKIHALRLLFVQPLAKDLKPTGDVLIAADEIGAGVGEMVIVTQGAPAMQAFDREDLIPVDAVVVGIVDSLDIPELVDDSP